MARSHRRTALFYDTPVSTREDVALLKAMLLFFDDIAVFATPQHHSRSPAIDQHLTAPLADRGLLQFVSPQAVLTSHLEVVIRATLHRAVIEKAEHWLAAAAAGDWDNEIPRLQGRVSGPLAITTGASSVSRGAGPLDLFKFLAQDGLLLPDESTDDEWFVTPGIASVANSILAQAVRATAGGQGWLIEPLATRRDEARVFTAILDGAIENVSASDVVTSDLSAVTVDLSSVGLDDILDFRARHRSELRAYVLALRAFVGTAPASRPLADRRAALVEEANRLRELQRRHWTHSGPTVSLGAIGASWTLGSGDLLGALIGSTRSGSPLLRDGATPVSAYTYLLRPDTEPASS
jgi:hypothetical protein